MDLGALGSGQLTGNSLSLQATMSITTAAGNSGFYGNLIIGDPPSAGAHLGAQHRFTQAMARLGADPAGSLNSWRAGEAQRYSMLARPRVALA